MLSQNCSNYVQSDVYRFTLSFIYIRKSQKNNLAQLKIKPISQNTSPLLRRKRPARPLKVNCDKCSFKKDYKARLQSAHCIRATNKEIHPKRGGTAAHLESFNQQQKITGSQP